MDVVVNFVVENQTWVVPVAAGVLANAFPAVPWMKILGLVVKALPRRK